MAHATTLLFPRSIPNRIPRAASQRPDVWQRFLDALDKLGANTPASPTALAYAHAYRAKSIPQER